MRYTSFAAAAFMATAVLATPVELADRGVVVEYKTVHVTAYGGSDGYPVQPVQTAVNYGHPHHGHRHHGHRHHGHHHKYAQWWRKYNYSSPDQEEPQPAPTHTVHRRPPHHHHHTHAPQPAATNTAPPSGGSPSGSFGDSCLETHNKYRALHGAGPLEWDDTMANFAHGVSATCVFEHSGGKYGENLAAGYSSAEAAIKAWYDEGSQYSYSGGDFSEATGHFTQVVWKGAKKVGCAQVNCDGSSGTPGVFLTCEYDQGNIIGEFTQNVLPS